MPITTDNILDELVAQKLITVEQKDEVTKISQETKKDVTDVLISKKIVDVEKLAEVEAKLWQLPYVNLLERSVPKDILEIIPAKVSNNYQVVCFDKQENKISVGVVNPGNLKAREAVNFLAKKEGYIVNYYVASLTGFKKAVNQYESLDEEVAVALEAEKAEKKLKQAAGKQKTATEEVTKAAPVAKIVSVVLRHAVEGKASDIHIEPYKDKSRVRYRIDGILHTSLTLPRNVHDAVIARVKVMANLKLDETRLPQDGRIRLTFGEKKIDFRVSILPLLDTEKVVMRILDVSRGAPKLAELGYHSRNLKIIENSIKKTDGMLLVTGPTGSGKSTTIFSILNLVNKEGVNISTLEDPVEYFLDGANQAQIRSEIDFTFATGLRSLLRQDPDIIMVGEIRDNETAELAIHSSLTGHMVLSTLHTNDSLRSLPRLADMKVEPFLLASTLNAVVAQRLVRKICEHCKVEVELADELRRELAEEMKKIYDRVDDKIKKLLDSTILNEEKKNIVYKGKGCSRCGNSGYEGRLAIAEVLEVNDDIRDIIISKKDLRYDDEALKKQRFITIKQDGIMRALEGLTSMEEVLRVMSD